MTHLWPSPTLTEALGGTTTRPFHATGVSIDTRSLRPGDLFVALRTARGDGHDHVAAALAAGAAGALVERTHDMPDGAPLIVVGDTLAGLTALGAFARARFTGAVLAVTGSVGKTTTKEMLRLCLATQGQVHAALASYNNHWGVPLTLARLPAEADFAVIEIGMNHPGEIAPLARLAAPDVAIITNIAATHIGNMGSLEAIATEKASISQGILQGGCLVLPGDCAQLQILRAAAGTLDTRLFGPANLLHVHEDESGSDVVADIAGSRQHFRLGAPGRHLVLNALAALTAAAALHLDLAECAAALADFAPMPGRGARAPILNGAAQLLDESYNASGASVRAALAVLARLPAQRRVAVLGDMLELGAHSRAEHLALAEPLGQAADLVFCCGPWMKHLYDALPASRRGAHAASSADLAPLVRAALAPGDVVLVKGSLGSRMRVVVDALADQPGGNG